MSSIKTENCIAIDFGTSNTAVMVYKNGTCQNPVYTVENYYCIPSVAVIDKDGIVVPDHMRSLLNSKGYIYNVKRILGKVKSQFKDSEIKEEIFHAPIKFDEHENPYFEVSYGLGKNKGSRNVYPIEVVTAILKKCKFEAEKSLDSHIEVRDCVMTIPNYFFDTSKIALQEAAKKAGLNVLYFVKEPTAAGIRYITGDEEIKEGETVLVFDFGGGTLDLTIMIRNGNRFEVKAQGGDPNLGGNKIDELFCDYVLQKYKNEYGGDLLGTDITSKKYKRQYSDLLLSCRQVKELLSSSDAADVSLSDFSENCDYIAVTQNDFNGNVMTAVNKRIKDALDNNTFASNIKEIRHIIMVGGSSKTSGLKPFLQRLIPKATIHDTMNPHTMVAEGALYHYINSCKVEEVFESALKFDIDGVKSTHFYPGIRLPCSTVKYVTLHKNKEDNKITVYREVNGEDRIEGVIKLKESSEMDIKADQTVRIIVYCSHDTSVLYTVIDRNNQEIGKYELTFIVFSQQHMQTR